MDTYIERYIAETQEIAAKLDRHAISKMIKILTKLREKGGRVFFIGMGGGAANASHAVNDFRKIAGIEAYTPVDNVSELTARSNDDGMNTIFATWLKGSRLNNDDAVFVFSVGGGNQEKNISINIVEALKYAKSVGARILGIVGRDGGYTARTADACVTIPTVSTDTVTPHTESFQAVVWHLIISHPSLRASEMKWESIN